MGTLISRIEFFVLGVVIIPLCNVFVTFSVDFLKLTQSQVKANISPRLIPEYIAVNNKG